MKTPHKFPDHKEATCLVCNHVISLKRPILYVAHDDDNAWKITCRPVAHKITELKVMPFSQAIKFDASLNDLIEMPPGVAAQRSNPSKTWDPFLLYPDTSED